MTFSSIENIGLNDIVCGHFSVLFYEAPAGHTFTKERLFYSTVLYIQKGSVFFKFENGTSVSGTENCILYLPMLMGYTATFAPDTDTKYVAIDMRFLDRNGDVLEFPTYAKQIMYDKTKSYYDKFASLEMHENTNRRFRVFEQFAQSMTLIFNLFHDVDIYNSANGKYEQLVPAIQYIELNYNKEFSSEYLAELCHMNVVKFRRYFKECIGVSPTDYKNSLRIRHAIEMLIMGCDSIGSVAIAVGIDDPHYFSRLFRRYAGTPPRTYKQKNT